MNKKSVLNMLDVQNRAGHVAARLIAQDSVISRGSRPTNLYGIPRGGIVPAFAVARALTQRGHNTVVVDQIDKADAFIDDIIDSGTTYKRYKERYPNTPFFALVNKLDADSKLGWVVFPWENNNGKDEGIEDNVRRILQHVDPSPDREGIADTPKRVARAWKQWASGYDKDAAEILKVFEDGASNYNEFVLVRDIPVYSKCEHHLADIFGTADVAYVPNGKIVGLSKLSRLVDMYARRLQVQERLTVEIAEALNTHLSPHGVAVRLRCRHMCMESRGICQQGHSTVTLATHGTLSEGPLRAEFLATGL